MPPLISQYAEADTPPRPSPDEQPTEELPALIHMEPPDDEEAA